MSRFFEDPEYERRLLDDLDRRARRMDSHRRQVRQGDVGRRLNDHARRYPYAAPGVLSSMAQAGVEADTDVAERLAALSGEMNVQQGELGTGGKAHASWFRRNVGGPLAAGFRTAVRGFTTAAHGVFHEGVSRPLTAAAEIESGLLEDPTKTFGQFAEAYREQGASPAVRAFQAWRAGRGPEGLEDEEFLGAGFVPGGRLYKEHREQLAERRVGEWGGGQRAIDVYGGDVSPGRAVAYTVMEPGSTGYDTVSGMLDLAAGLFLDPTAKVGGGISKVTKAQRTFGASADLLPRTRRVLEGAQIVGPRRTTIARDVEDFLTRDLAGRRMVEHLAGVDSPAEVWRALGRKVDPQVARKIAERSDPDEVRAALRETLGTNIREKPTSSRLSRGITRPFGSEVGQVYGAGAAMRHRFADGITPRDKSRLALSARLTSDVPGTEINVDDMGTAMRQVEEFAKNARLTPEVTNKYLDRLTEIDPDDPARVTQVWDMALDMMKDVDKALVKQWGRQPHHAEQLTKLMEDFHTEVRQYFIDELGRPGYFPGAKTRLALDGGTEVLPTAHTLSEFTNRHVPLPSVKGIRRDTSELFKALEKVPHLRESVEMADLLHQTYILRPWKFAQLLRGAWAVRVVGDEQLRMGASGMDSAFNHPVSWIAWMTGRRGNLDITGAAMGPARGKRGATTDAYGNVVGEAQEFLDAMSHSADWIGDGSRSIPGTVYTGDYVQARKGEREFVRGWGDELNQLATQTHSQRVAGGLRDGDAGYNPLTATSDQAIKDWFWNSDELRRLDEGPAGGQLSASRANADAYIDSVKARIHIKAGGSAEMRDAAGRRVDPASATPDELANARWVVTRDGDADIIAGIGEGRILDVPVHETVPYDGMSEEIAKALQSKMNIAPEVVKVSRNLTIKGRRGERISLMDRLDKVWDTAMHGMMGQHTDRLSRAPVFRQHYWDEAERLLTSMSQEVQDAVFVNARKANLNRDTLSRMGRIVGDPKQVGDAITNVNVADDIAKAHALTETKKMLYDLSKRNQFMDVTRVLFPFGEAFKEVLTTWARIGKENPQTIERARQVAMSGFFTEGPFGEEVFAYPGGDMPGLFGGVTGAGAGGMLGGVAGPMGALVGAGIGAAAGAAIGNAADPGGPGQVDMTGNASGLNMITQSFLPGFGPIVQMAASAILPQKPGIWSDIEELVLPYGRSEASEEGVLESMAPAWGKRLLTAIQGDPDSDRVFGNTVGEVAAMKYASGEYSDENGMVTPEQNQRLLQDSVRSARWLYALRAVAQYILPTGPQAQMSADTPEGLQTFKVLSDEFREMAEDEEAGGYDTALQRWVERFGLENTLVLQAKTKERRKRSMGETGVAWERNNPDLVEEFPDVIGWFAPEGDDDPFDYTAYKAAIARGDLEVLRPKEQLMLHNHRLGLAAMAKVDAELGDRTDAGARAYRRDMRLWLKSEYPGFDSTIATPVREDREFVIAQFNRAVEHPKLKDTELAKGWRAYMEAREEARAQLPEGLSTFKGQGAAHLARYLRDTGRYLSREYPGFGEVFNRILESELREEEDA